MGINEKAWGIGFKRLIGDESNPTYGICVDNTSKALHICDIEDAGTDWTLPADSYPSVYIHDIANPITDYLKFYHDGTNGIIDCDGTTILAMTASSLAISGTVATDGLITSTSTIGFRSNPTFVPDSTRTNYAFSVGNRVAELTVDMANAASQNFDPIQMNIDLTASGGAPTSSSTVNMIYQQITHDTVDMPNLRLKGSDWTISVGKNTKDAYVVQTELAISGNITFSGEASAGAFQLNVGAGPISVSSRLNALMAIVVGAATVTGNYYVADFGGFTNAALDSILNLQTDSGSSATSGILMDIDGTVTYAIDFQGTVSDGWTSGSAAITHSNSNYALIPVKVEGVGVTLYLLAGETWA